VPIEVPDESSTDAAIGDVATKSLGTDMPMSTSCACLDDCALDGIGMGTDT
jgi:hypothetical protein